MYVTSLKIENYKSFWQSELIPLERGLNLIVGQNDSGKTAILEALLPNTGANPHRSMLNAPDIPALNSPNSRRTIRFQLSGDDVLA